MNRYTFKCVEPVEFCKKVEVTHNGELACTLPLYPNIWYRFTTSKLTEWIGKDNTSIIVNHGEVITLERESPINLKFSTHK